METQSAVSQNLGDKVVLQTFQTLFEIFGARVNVRTAERFIRSMREMTSGYEVNVEALLSVKFDVDAQDIVVLKDIRFTALCEHHLLPFIGTASVAYIPGKETGIVGISKLARLVEAFAKRLQVQERMTQEICDAMALYLHPRGAAVIIKARHCCVGCRGVNQPDAVMVTSRVAGCFLDEPAARQEVMELLG